MRTALCGKSAMWEVLRDIPAGETEEQYRELNDLVSKQIRTVTGLHHRAATEAFQGVEGRQSASGGDPIRSSK